MHELLYNKLISLHGHLLTAYNDSSAYPAPITGREREVFLHALLEKILPPHFRVGSGIITDYRQKTTGQIDLVVELPLSLSFPVVGENRMYFADTVGAAMEIKSDLNFQWDEAYEKWMQVNALSTKKRADPDGIELKSEYQIPFFMVAYKGPKKAETIEKKLHLLENYPMAGIYIVESNYFLGHIDNHWISGDTAATSLLAFITSLYTALSKQQHRPVSFRSYNEAQKA